MELCGDHDISISSHVGVSICALQIVFIGFICYFLYHVVSKIRKQKRKYFKQFWNILELVTVIMSVLTCAMYGAKIMFGNTAMDVLREAWTFSEKLAPVRTSA